MHATRFIARYVLLVFALSIPFWWFGAATDSQVAQGLSAIALTALCPMVVALILVHRVSKAQGVPELPGRSFDFRRIDAKRWYVPIDP